MTREQSSGDQPGASRPDRLTLIAFILLAVFAGGNPADRAPA